MSKLLVIGRTFPEPNTTAAGGRMMRLLDVFLEQHFQITFVSSASISSNSADLKSLGIHQQQVNLNEDSFDRFLQELQADVVLFDRFISEEHFGWRVSEQLPHAIKILDTEDLHFLRKARENAFKKNVAFNKDQLYNDFTKRELASILRCDLSLIISEFEMKLLQDEFKISSSILHYLPFMVKNETKAKATPSFDEREDFITVGNLFHAPNVDAVLFLKKEIWPLIRKQLPRANLHVYGAYAPQQITDLHNEKEGFLIKGWVENIDKEIQKARVVLAPLRFGAGLKGKLLSAMLNKTPMVTTMIGAEAMYGNYPIPGAIENNAADFANAAVKLYQNEPFWQEKLKAISSILSERFDIDKLKSNFIQKLGYLQENTNKHRKQNFIGQVMQYQNMQSTKYLSKWIAEKNK